MADSRCPKGSTPFDTQRLVLGQPPLVHVGLHKPDDVLGGLVEVRPGLRSPASGVAEKGREGVAVKLVVGGGSSRGGLALAGVVAVPVIVVAVPKPTAAAGAIVETRSIGCLTACFVTYLPFLFI